MGSWVPIPGVNLQQFTTLLIFYYEHKYIISQSLYSSDLSFVYKLWFPTDDIFLNCVLGSWDQTSQTRVWSVKFILRACSGRDEDVCSDFDAQEEKAKSDRIEVSRRELPTNLIIWMIIWKTFLIRYDLLSLDLEWVMVLPGSVVWWILFNPNDTHPRFTCPFTFLSCVWMSSWPISQLTQLACIFFSLVRLLSWNMCGE